MDSPRRPNVATPQPTYSTNPSRRDTIMNLVEMLLKQNDEMSPAELEQSPSLEDDRDVPTVDEHLQAAGAETYRKFQKKVNNLDTELRSFSNASRQLGGSVAILSRAFHLRARLAYLLFLYHENAADLFPRKIQRYSVAPSQLSATPPRRATKTTATQELTLTPTVDTRNLDPEDLPEQLDLLATELMFFLKALNEFPEFVDEGVNNSIGSFEMDLKYWASCLREYQGQFRYPAVQRYVHDLTGHMGEHIDQITRTLSMFVEIGVPTIRFSQQHSAENLLNLSTVSTFFSGITATAIQYSIEYSGTPLAHAVNALWFASLVFSISAAVNSLLGLTWKQALYRSPKDRVPWWVLIWIKRSPLLFLVLSVACFSLGLCCFAYASNQDTVTSALTSVLTAVTSFGLVAVSLWFASERWIFMKHRGRKWLSDALHEVNHQFMHLQGVTTIRKSVKTTSTRVRQASVILKDRTMSVVSLPSASEDKEREDDLESGVIPSDHPDSFFAPERAVGIATVQSKVHTSEGSSSSDHGDSRSMSAPTPPPRVSISEPLPRVAEKEPQTTKGKELWKHAIRTIRLTRSSFPPPQVRKPIRKRTGSGKVLGGRDAFQDEVNKPGRLRSRIAALGPRLEALDVVQEFDAHQALVRHLQFSPDGKYLATSSWDKTAVIFKVGDPFIAHRTLAHPQGFVSQVAWSPDSKTLLTKMSRAMRVWNAEDGFCSKTINRGRYIESITWCPTGDAFLSVEGSHVVMLDLDGQILAEFDFGRMRLHDVAMTPDSKRLLGVGPLIESPSGLHPSTSKVEKRLVVYNTEDKQIENLTPVLNDVRDITISRTVRHGPFVLVSYEDKAPPQLWKLDLVKDRDTGNQSARFSLRHTYLPKSNVDFAGTSYFGGPYDDLVFCAGKAGDIHIWDTESGSLLRRVRSQVVGGGDLTCVAWNHALERPFMFATGSHDGTIRIWSRPLEEIPSASFRTSSPLPFAVDDMRKTDSPVSQKEFEEAQRLRISTQDSLAVPGVASPSARRARTVGFMGEAAQAAHIPRPIGESPQSSGSGTKGDK